MAKENVSDLVAKAKEIRRHIIEMTTIAGSGHPTSSLSSVEIMVALYFRVLRYNPHDPNWEDRDRFILSKGHAAPVLYAVLAEAGYISTEELRTLRKIGSRLQGHPAVELPGIEVATGALGQGLSVANGMALAGKLDGKDYRVYVLLGDGELDEGQIWEAAMSAVKYKLDNLAAIIDYNGLQQTGSIDEVMPLEPLTAKWQAFGWHVLEIDGHDFSQILLALAEAKTTRGQPSVIVAHTIKGKGVSFLENALGWHGKAPNAAQSAQALAELA